MANLTKYALLLDDSALKAVERLQSTYELKTKADVYDLAVRLLTWATEQKVNGYEFGRFKEETFQPVNMLREPNEEFWRKTSKKNGSMMVET